jgi:hypothetical protein
MSELTAFVRVEHDPDVDDPYDDETWEFISFDRRMKQFKDPDTLGVQPMRNGDGVITDKALKRKYEAGSLFWLDCYRHSGEAWSLHGGGMQCQWDTAPNAGLLIMKATRSNWWRKLTYEQRCHQASKMLEVFNDWNNGNCYWYQTLLSDDTGEDSCGGWIGDDVFVGLQEWWDGLAVKPTLVECRGDAAFMAETWAHRLKGVQVRKS